MPKTCLPNRDGTNILTRKFRKLLIKVFFQKSRINLLPENFRDSLGDVSRDHYLPTQTPSRHVKYNIDTGKYKNNMLHRRGAGLIEFEEK